MMGQHIGLAIDWHRRNTMAYPSNRSYPMLYVWRCRVCGRIQELSIDKDKYAESDEIQGLAARWICSYECGRHIPKPKAQDVKVETSTGNWDVYQGKEKTGD